MIVRKFILIFFCLIILISNCSKDDNKALSSFAVVLENINISVLKELHKDYLVIDYSFDGSKKGEIPLSEITKLKGSGKKVFAYMCIGEAEDYRFYWQQSYTQKWPAWILRENPEWKGNYLVKYWDRSWKEILQIYMERIKAAGFDGLFLDKVDAYNDFKEDELPEIDKKEEMKSLLHYIFEKNRVNSKDFQILLNGGEELMLEDAIIKEQCIGVLLESLYTDGKNRERSQEEYEKRETDLKTLERFNKKIFILEHASEKNLQKKLKKISRKNHFSIEYAKPDLSL